MAGLVGEADHLVLDRGAVTRTAPRQLAAIDGALAQVLGDDAVGFLGRMSDAAGDLRDLDAIGQEAERHRLLVRRLHLQLVPSDGAAVQASGRAGLQTPHHQARAIEVSGQTDRRRLAEATGGDALLAAMDDPVEEGARRQDHGAGAKLSPLARRHADDAVAVQDQGLGGARHQGQVRRLGQLGLHGLAVQPTVNLAARAAHGGALGAVQQAELDAGHIGQTPHDAVESIDLAHQMSLAQTADGRVAAHLSDCFQLLGQQQSAGARARRGGGGLTAGVSAADDDDVEGCGGGGTHGRGHSLSRPKSPLERRRCFT
ncbi:hypothetical protein D3C87_1344190 [compost metagenome]